MRQDIKMVTCPNSFQSLALLKAVCDYQALVAQFIITFLIVRYFIPNTNSTVCCGIQTRYITLQITFTLLIFLLPDKSSKAILLTLVISVCALYKMYRAAWSLCGRLHVCQTTCVLDYVCARLCVFSCFPGALSFHTCQGNPISLGYLMSRA